MAVQSESRAVLIASDGGEALAILQRFRPDLAFLDLNMPKADGYSVSRFIRSQSWGRFATVVAVTGLSDNRTREATAAAGFDIHLVKPVDLKVIESVLAGTLRPIDEPEETTDISRQW